MKVQAVNKKLFKDNLEILLEQENTALISILNSGRDRLTPDTQRVITLWFDDIHPTTTMTLGSCEEYNAMNVVDALNLIEFVLALPTNINRIIVHCSAGMCRSGAVADFLRVVFAVDNLWFVQNNPQIIPNEWVRVLLWMTWKMKHSEDRKQINI